MPYVQRSPFGEIIGVYYSPQTEYADEYLDDSNEELIKYLSLNRGNTYPFLYAISEIQISESQITSVTTSAQISAVFYIETGTYWVFFEESQPNTNYIPLCYNHNHTVFVSEKTEDFFVVSALAGGVASDPMSLSVEVKRVQ